MRSSKGLLLLYQALFSLLWAAEVGLGAPMTQERAEQLMAAAKLDVVAQGRLKIQFHHAAVAGAQSDDPNGVVISLAAHLDLAAQAEPAVSRLSLPSVTGPWKTWDCPLKDGESGQTLDIMGKSAFDLTFYARPAVTDATVTAAFNVSSNSTAKAATSNSSTANSSTAYIAEKRRSLVRRLGDVETTEGTASLDAYDPRLPETVIGIPENNRPAGSRDLTELGAESLLETFEQATTKNSSSNVTTPKAGMFEKECAQEFYKNTIQEFGLSIDRVFAAIDKQSDWYLPFKGKSKFECDHPEGMNWEELAAKIADNSCLPCYEKSGPQTQIGNTAPAETCRHKNEAEIRAIHPTWSVTHSPNLPHSLRDGQKFKAWAETRDPERRGTCNYVGCSNPSEEPQLRSSNQMHQQTGEDTKSSSDGDDDTANAEWSCLTNTKVTATVSVTTGVGNITIKAEPTQQAKSLGFSEECAKEFMGHMKQTIARAVASYLSSMETKAFFQSQSSWGETTKQLIACECAGLYDSKGKGGICKQWDNERGEDPTWWCYASKTCKAPGVQASTLDNLVKRTACCGDSPLFASQCPVWAQQQKCTHGGDSGMGKETRDTCPKACGVCRAYV